MHLDLAPLPGATAHHQGRTPAGLTDRQLEVLQHVAAGRTNSEIAEALFLSVRTVDHHVSATLTKLGVTSRKDAAQEAQRLGFAPARDSGFG